MDFNANNLHRPTLLERRNLKWKEKLEIGSSCCSVERLVPGAVNVG
jgi:hypothetical protein